MALTAAERMKRYRERLKTDPEKLEQIRKRNLERIKSKYKYKKISEMSETERKSQRRKWKEEKRKQKEKKKPANKQNCTQSTAEVGSSTLENISDTLDASKAKDRASRLKLRRELNDAKCRINFLQRSYESSRKKIYRLQQTITKEKKMFETELLKLTARNEILEASLKLTYKNCKNNKERDTIKNIAQNDLVMNTKAKTSISRQIGIQIKRKKAKLRRISEIKKSIVDFYMRDDVTRATAGKHECRTLKKNKQQIRYLNNTLLVLHERYKKEGGLASYSSFCRYKPFFILSPSIHNRNTCLCVKHSNMTYKIAALYRQKIIDFSNTHTLLEKVACDVQNYDCMNSKCNTCKNAQLNYNLDESEQHKNINWEMWETVQHSYKKKTSLGDREMKTKKTVKSHKSNTIKELINIFEADIPAFKIHCFNANHQIKSYNYCVENLSHDEIAIHCDFSQNYECKLAEEVQSMHFGASKGQVTLHTGVIFYKGGQKSFCTVSPCNEHQPPAIWAHLKPIIYLGKTMVPEVKRIHIFSDRPSSQYRQKNNFFLTNYFSTLYNVEISWSFFECSHGKGVADAIGGVTKRLLDRKVAYGQDIVDATDVYSTLKSSLKTVHVAYVNEEDINSVKQCIPDNLETINGTMKIHQVIYMPGSAQIKHRTLSCFCSLDKISCSCFDPIKYTFPDILNIALNPRSNDITFETTTAEDINDEPRLPEKHDFVLNKALSPRRDVIKSKTINIEDFNDEPRLQEKQKEDIQNSKDEIQSVKLPILDSHNKKIYQDDFCLLNDLNIPNLPIVIMEDDDIPAIGKQSNEGKKTEDNNFTENDKENQNINTENLTIDLTDTKIIPKTEKRKVATKKSLTYVISRKVICNGCKNATAMHDLFKCIVCKQYYCLICSGTDKNSSIDFICDPCLNID